MSPALLEVLEKKGSISDIDLYREVMSNFGEVSFRELNRELKKLELAGILRVSRLHEGQETGRINRKTDLRLE